MTIDAQMPSLAERQRADLYRQCPSAFWLAPEADWLPDSDGPMLPAVPDIDNAPAPKIVVHAFRHMLLALTAAGPIFFAAAMACEGLAAHGTTGSAVAGLAGAVLLSAIVVPFGAVLALLPVLLGTVVMGFASERWERARHPLAWSVTGGAMGVAIAGLFDAGASPTIALLITGLACAAVVRSGVWFEEIVAVPAE
ncbi:hypothetical protein [Sphingomonas aracearum]|uniref:Uncharacterized protein n=1 Tax=Sphingomonas aracearum TaxID=2283317 RepID=A0A369VU48_9SPHN|nr:hypothetical protein [Sphingomonas aracearum]RDE05175.1 hypothetical protein DVW87_07815 [Sphingomonas aracearum]